MRPGIVAVLLALPLVVRADEKKGDLKAMQGTWQVVAVEQGGKKGPEEDLKKADPRLTIDGNKFEYKSGEKKLAHGTFTLDEKKTPPTIDVDGKGADGKEQKTVGIYELKGDTMRVCFVHAGEDRPKEFKTEEGKKHALITYKRVKDK